MRTEVLRLKPLPPGIPPEEVETRVRCNGQLVGGAVEFKPGEDLHVLVTRYRIGSNEGAVDTFHVVAPTEPEEFHIAIGVEEVR